VEEIEGLTGTGTSCGDVYEGAFLGQGVVRLTCTLPPGHEGLHQARVEGDARWGNPAAAPAPRKGER
jgi:hypothetical protein